MPESDLFRGLAELLRSGGAQPIVLPERVARSSTYDVNYRVSIIACAFELHAKSDSSTRRIHTARLKLLQFIAIRPWLVPVLKEWSQNETDPQLSMLTSQRMRRGFLSDSVHDHVVEYLLARQFLAQGPAHLSLGANGGELEKIAAGVKAENLFEDERGALAEMENIKVTNKMLEGW